MADHARMPPRRDDLRRRVRRWMRPAWMGTLRRTRPLSDRWGSDRGTPVDRYYIERFLDEHRADIRGRVLEVKDAGYTKRFGNAVTEQAVLDVDAGNPHATVIADLSSADALASEYYDCFVLTQVLQLIPDTRAALAHAHRMLRPGGVLLATMPAVSRMAGPADYWRFTHEGCRSLLVPLFGEARVTVEAHGNVLTAMAFLTGMAWEELTPRELETQDQAFPFLITARAVKA